MSTKLLAGFFAALLLAGLAALALGRPTTDSGAGGASPGGGAAESGAPAAPPAASADDTPGGTTASTDGAPRLGALRATDRLRVRRVGDRRVLTGADGRPVLLRGASVNALLDYGPGHARPIPVREVDFEQMAALGLTAVRLAVNWSEVMPAPGRLDRTELRRITTLVRQAGRQRIHTVVSFHGDRYAAGLGTGTEFDGAPRWAVFTDGQPCGDPRPRYYTACAAAAARHFYRGESVAGRRGVDWYADAAVAIARAGRAGGPGYAGLDILNEPTDPDANPDADATGAWARRLHALQRTVVQRLRRDGERAPVWIQPQGPRATATTRDAVLPRDLGDRQVVYAPHAYVDVYDGSPTEATRERLREQYDAFADEARALGAAMVIGEFPGAAGGAWDELREEHLLRQREAGIGGIAWLWKQPASGYGWGTLSPDGGVRGDTDAAQVLSAPRLLAGAGDVTLEAATDGSGAATLRGGAAGGVVDVWLGTGFGDADAARARGGYRLEGAGGARVVATRRARAELAGVPAAGTLLRISLPAGAPAARIVPVG